MLVTAGCASFKTIDEFKKQWNQSISNSAESWWYLGESSEAYYLLQSNPAHKSKYKISKEKLKITGVLPFSYKEGLPPVNLKSENLQLLGEQ